jgi:hypothetical protein
MHKPLKGAFNEILAAVALGSGNGKRAARRLQSHPTKVQENKLETIVPPVPEKT